MIWHDEFTQTTDEQLRAIYDSYNINPLAGRIVSFSLASGPQSPPRVTIGIGQGGLIRGEGEMRYRAA